METNVSSVHREPWNKGKIVGQKAPFKVKDIWALRVRLQMEERVRELALFNLGIDLRCARAGVNHRSWPRPRAFGLERTLLQGSARVVLE